MNDAAQIFAIELGRAVKRSAHLLSGLRPADRDDAIAAAMLQCWETREQLDRTKEPLDAWFAQSLRESVRHIRRSSRSRQYASMKLNEIGGIDSTSQSAEAQISAEQLMEKLSDREQAVAMQLAQGYSLSHIATDLRMPHSELKKITRKLKKLSDNVEFKTPRIGYAPPLDSDHRDIAPSAIDHEIEKLLRRPASERADCVPCWKCMYFEGWSPVHYHPPALIEPEIQAAVAVTELRKIEIANVRV